MAGIPYVTAIETGGYVVQPAYGIYPEYSDLYFTPRSADTGLLNNPFPIPIGLVDLPPWILVILGIAAIIPGTVYTSKYLSAANFSLIGGFKRISRKNIFENSSREAIFRCLKENPGIGLADMERSTGFSCKNLIYHLNILSIFGMVTLDECKNTTGYFQNLGNFSHEERTMMMYLNHPSDRKIVEAILHHPGISRHEISNHVGISGPSVSWHIHFLLHDRIIEQKKEGNIARHYVMVPMIKIYKNLLSANGV